MSASRLFLAVPVPPGVREEIGRLLPAPLPGRTVPPRNWHLTLRFLGQVTDERRAVLERWLHTAELGSAHTLRLARLGGFPALRRARILWLGPEAGDAGPLARVAAAVDAAVEAAGEPARDRPFHPHLTLSRLRTPRDIRALTGDFRGGANLPVDAVVLFRSLPGDGAPRYEQLESFALRRSP